MADRRISRLPSQSNPAGDDLLAGVDVSESRTVRIPVSFFATANALLALTNALSALVRRVAALEGGSPPTPSTIDVRVVWSVDRVITAAELDGGQTFDSDTFNIPAQTGFAYLVIWASNAGGGAPSGISFDGHQQRAAFDDVGTDLITTNGVAGQYVVSLVELDGDDISGQQIILT